MDIITPKNALFVKSSDQSFDAVLNGTLRITHVGNTKLTCCCEYQDMIVCGGFTGELFFLRNMELEYIKPISNSILRSIVPFQNKLLISSDGGELILFEGGSVIFVGISDSPVYKILPLNEKTFLSGERSGAINEWNYLSNRICFNRTIANAEESIFALSSISDEIIATGSKGKMYLIDTRTNRVFDKTIAPCNVFCLSEGLNSEVYFGLANGNVLRKNNDDIKIMEAHQDAVRDIAFSINKRWMFSVSKDNSVRAWNNDVPHILSMGRDYLYQVVVGRNYIFYVDGHGDLGRIDFDGDIDSAKEISIQE